MEGGGVRWTFIVPGILTTILSVISFVTLYTIPASSTFISKPRMKLKELLTHPEIRMVAIPSLINGAIRNNITLWMALFFVDRFSIRIDQSAYYVLLVPTIGFAGRLLYPAIYRVCQNEEHKVSLWAFAICLLSSIILSLNGWTPFISAISLGVMYTAASIASTSLLTIYPARFSAQGNIASVSGLLDFCTFIGTGISSVLYGKLIESFGYRPMFLSWSILSVVAIWSLNRIMKKNY